jgi:hypothetical protein
MFFALTLVSTTPEEYVLDRRALVRFFYVSIIPVESLTLLDHAFARHCKHPFDSTKGCPPLSYFE